MRIIVPMAGMGKRMRPHTLSIPKPLIKIAGKRKKQPGNKPQQLPMFELEKAV